jgi:hypothetical protein
LKVLVQTFSLDASASVAPAGIVPTLAPAAVPPGDLVTVLPLEVTDVVGVLLVVVGVRDDVDVVVVVFLVVVVGVVATGVGAVELAGTSVNAGCAAVSRFASWMSLLRAESAAVFVSDFAQAPMTSANESASDALNRGIYCTMKPPPCCVGLGEAKLMNRCGRQSTCQI